MPVRITYAPSVMLTNTDVIDPTPIVTTVPNPEKKPPS
jgi:hypothetical protein